jgi:hypothetical protein
VGGAQPIALLSPLAITYEPWRAYPLLPPAGLRDWPSCGNGCTQNWSCHGDRAVSTPKTSSNRTGI